MTSEYGSAASMERILSAASIAESCQAPPSRFTLQAAQGHSKPETNPVAETQSICDSIQNSRDRWCSSLRAGSKTSGDPLGKPAGYGHVLGPLRGHRPLATAQGGLSCAAQ